MRITTDHEPQATPEVLIRPGGAHVQPALVVVQRAWSEWRTALVRVGELEDVHWFRPAGAIRPLIHAYVC